MNADVSALIAKSQPMVQDLLRLLHGELVELGCSSYVKTIYIGYEVDGQMVAAAYPMPTAVEVALAIAEDRVHRLLRGASHLTWRTMPLLASITRPADVLEVRPLLIQAVNGVMSGTHTLSRDNEFFMRAKKSRANSRIREQPREE